MLDCRRRREVMLWHSHVCWTVANWSFFPCSWGSEAWVYQRIHELQNNVFCKILDHGEILCPSVFLKGYILVISMAEGEPLSVIWDDLACPSRIMVVHNAAKPYPSFAASPYGLQTRARRTLFFRGGRMLLWWWIRRKSLDVDAPEMLRILGCLWGSPLMSSINLTLLLTINSEILIQIK